MSARKSSNTQGTAQRGFDKELAEIEALIASFRSGIALDENGTAYLRKALAHRNNFLVSKAAGLVADAELFALLPEVLAAYDLFFVDAEKSDPQCWAKNALVKTLVKLEHRQKDAYLRGLRHHQLEASWGKPNDTAGTLRSACAHALVDCPGIHDADLLTLLLDPLTDTDKSVRMEAARAIGQVGGTSAALILRLRALLANDEPEVLGTVFSALLSVEGDGAIALVEQAMKEGDELAAEAAFALADLRKSSALAALQQRLRAGADAWFRGVLLSAIALTRLPEANDFLVAFILRDAREAEQAIKAIAHSAPHAELRARVEMAVGESGSARLLQAFRQHFS